MAIQVSRASLAKVETRLDRALNRLRTVKKEGEAVMEKMLATAETSGMAFGLGILNGYHGPITVAKVPLEVLLAGTLSLGGYFGLAGKHSDHLNHLGNGALAAWSVVKGVQIGAELKAKQSGQAASQPSATKGTALSADDVRALIAEQVARAAA